MRTQLALGALAPVIESKVAAVDPGIPITGLRTQEEQVRQAVGRELLFAQLLAAFSAFALLLACIGLYGITSYAVARRRPELGVRIALGAQPRQIVRLVLGQVLGLTAVGVIAGVVAAYLLGPLVQSMLYGVAPGDFALLLAASLVMAVTAVASAWLPALRAARTDALEVLSGD
jgi:ABC-type antimicrobial peptide transport system permease subunit